jgi:PAS domain S-box-containing protein
MSDETSPTSGELRSKVLERYAILDTEAEPAFDRIVALGTQLSGVRMASLAVMTKGRVFIKAFAGGPKPEVMLEDSISKVAVETGHIFQVSDARADPRFAASPNVAGGLRMRFFAAAPLVSPEGVAFGALCLIDPEVRDPLDAREQRLLEDLAATAVDALELRAALARARENEVALRQADQNFRSLVDNSPDATFVVDGGSIAYANAAAAQLLGFLRPADLIGRYPLDFIHPDHKPIIHAMLNLRTPVSASPHERHLLRQDGSSVVVEARAMQIPFRGRPAVLAVYRDLTERRALESRVRHSERMASLGTLAAGIGHEINNPLSFVIANVAFATGEIARTRAGLAQSGAEEARDAANGLAETAQALSEASEGAERVRRIVRDLKNVWRIEEQPRSLVDVTRPIESALEQTDREIRPRARLLTQLAPVPPIEANEAELSELFVNLLRNAAQSIPDGAAGRNEVSLSTSFDPVSRQVVVEIKDSGAGMTPEVQARIFDPFFTTRPVGSGTGLGLAICHSIVDGIGGEITVRSQVGQGSVFRVSFPARSARVDGQLPSTAVPGATPGRRGRVLVIDDEELVGRALRRALGREQDVENVTRGAEALKRLSSGERYDVILCDLAMPEMTGMELYERIVALDRDQAARMLFITGGTASEAGREFLARFPGRCFEKPFEPQRLRDEVRKRLAEQPPVRHLRIAK